MQFQLIITDPTVKVLIHRFHKLEHLLLVDRETHPLKHIVELINFDVIVLVVINFFEDLLQS